MKDIHSIQLRGNSREEVLPGFTPDFPYVATKAHLDRYEVLWHWHRAVELFYMESGTLEYYTPGGVRIFPPGSGGFVNTGMLHTSKPRTETGTTVQLLHIFDASLLAGCAGSRIEQKFIAPLITSPSIEILAFSPEKPEEAELLRELRASFTLSEQDFGYELRLREALSRIWLKMLALPRPAAGPRITGDEKIKGMLNCIHEHFGERLSVAEIAAAAFISEREGYRLFQQVLRTTPADYLRRYRLQAAGRLLKESTAAIGDIALQCGFGSASAFGKAFREQNGLTPVQYRRQWQDWNK